MLSEHAPIELQTAQPIATLSAAEPEKGATPYTATASRITKKTEVRRPQRAAFTLSASSPTLASDVFLRDLGGLNVAVGLESKARSISTKPNTQLSAWHMAAPGTIICFECAAQHHSTRERSEPHDLGL